MEVGGSKEEAKIKNAKGPESSGEIMEKFVFPFEKLDVWKLSVDLADRLLGIIEKVPVNKHFRLVSQMEGAVTSIAQNIAEGKGRGHKKEFARFLSIAEGSLYETVTLIEIYKRRNLFRQEECLELRARCEAIDRKINGLRRSVLGSSNPQPKTS